MIAADLYRHGDAYPDYGMDEPALRAWKEMPPMGGWGVSILANGSKPFVDGPPLQIADKIDSIYKFVGQEVPVRVIWNYLNHMWLSRDPKRALIGVTPPPSSELDRKPWDYTTLAIQWLGSFTRKFDTDKWVSAIQHISALVDPANQHDTADADFFERLTKARIESTPRNEQEVATWLRLIS